MDAETGFLIDGNRYEVPTIGTLTIDEAQILYDYCGLTVEDIVAAPDDDETVNERIKTPAFKRALVHIAYQRGNPTIDGAEVKRLVGAVNILSALEALVGRTEGDDEQNPPASTSEPMESSPSDSLENEHSKSPNTEQPGNDSLNASGEPVVQLVTTTPSKSDTSPILARELSGI